MLRLVGRRARAQAPLLAALLAVVVIGTTLLGVCVLVLTTSRERAADEAASRAPAAAVDVTAFLADVGARNAGSVDADTRAELAATLSPFPVTTSARVSGVMRQLGPRRSDPQHLGYLSAVDGLAARARLTTGRWPAAGRPAAGDPLECVVLAPTATRLHLRPGSRVVLGPEIGGGDGGSVTLVVVGVFRPAPGTGWDRDPLGATGYEPAYNDGTFPKPARAYGPFVVDRSALYGGASTLDRLQLTAHPDLAGATIARLDAAAASVAGADRRLSRRLGERVGVERIASDLPVTLSVARSQQAATASTVLVVALLGTVLTAAALGLAGRLVADLRRDETALLSSLGASRRQLAGAAVVEAAALAVPAAVLSVPLSALAHSALTHLPLMADAGLTTGPVVTAAQVAAVAAGALLLGAVLVVPALRPDPAAGSADRSRRGRAGLLARSGADVALLGLAVAGWWQLRAQPPSASGPDAVRVLAPAVCLVAGAAVAQRLVTLPLRGAERLARRARGLVLPLAVFEAARRPKTFAAVLLVSLAAAAGTFGVAFGATWEGSQRDQAAARVGTDLSLTLAGPAEVGQGAAVAAATGGQVSPVTDRGVAVGEWLGGSGPPPRLVALDTAAAGALLRGRLDGGRTWAGVGAGLAPTVAVDGLPVPAGRDLTLTGTATGGTPLLVTPRLVLQDADGLRVPCAAGSVPLDGRPHRLHPCGRGEGRLVAVDYSVGFDPTRPGASSAAPVALLTLSLALPGSADVPGASRGWSAVAAGEAGRLVSDASSSVGSAGDRTTVRTSAGLALSALADPVDVVATAFRPPAPVPVVLSRSLADVLLVKVGDQRAVTVGSTRVPIRVHGIVTSIPSAPAAAGILVDGDALSRALLAAGDVEPPVDAWWVGHPTRADAGARASALGLGPVVTRAGVTRDLARGPLRAGLPAALVLLVPAAVVLLLAGTLMHVTSDVEARAVEVARLRGLGLSRRDLVRGLLLQHGGVLALLVAVGAVVGALAARAVGPPLVRSDVGAAPVPPALADWPWLQEGALLIGLLAGGILAVALVVGVQVRRADAAHLRVGP